MLTGDLVRVRVKKKELHPGFIKVDNPRHLESAAKLLGIFAAAHAVGWTRKQVEAKLLEMVGDSTEHKMLKGMAKVLADAGEFETISPLDPVELRAKVFRLAAATGPIARRAGPTGRRVAADVCAEIATEVGSTAEDVATALYADHKENQVLTSWKAPRCAGSTGPAALLNRYNVALVQAVLLKASHLELNLARPDPKRLRQLTRYLKFFQLMYRLDTDDMGNLHLVIDGPQSLLRQSTRYGMQLATFLPAILLQTTPWALTAEVLWGKKRKFRKQLQLDSGIGLQSHYQDRGAWRSRTEEWFETRFSELESDWTLGPGEAIDMGGQAMLVPDFTFKKDGRTGHLDIVGYWRKGYLEKRLAHTPDNVILAVSKRLAGDKVALPKTLASRVVTFAEIIPAKDVLSRLEACAT